MARPFFLLIVGFMVFLVPPYLWAASYGWYPYPQWGQLALVAALISLFAYAAFSSRPLLAPIPLLAMVLVGVGLVLPIIMPVMVGGANWGMVWFTISLSVPVVGCCILRSMRSWTLKEPKLRQDS